MFYLYIEFKNEFFSIAGVLYKKFYEVNFLRVFFRTSLTPGFILLAVILRYTTKFFSIKQSIFS